ncbi:hypothetical protein [Bifidobacterium longum]|uniref:hypothetical protein n=1 Tax=Bifidobacterium longum TaxID=216816 RepID=UPI003CFCBBEC
MLSKGEAAALLSLINAHHGNAQWDDVQLDAFYSELRSDITAVEAREAVKRFYADNDSGRWMGSGDVNAMIRQLRNKAKPSEAEIARECDARGLEGDAAWLYRRQRMLGRQPEEAARITASSRNPLELEPAKPKRRTPVRHFLGAGDLGLGDILPRHAEPHLEN